MINPYEPPRAEVEPADLGQNATRAAPPKSVTRAVTCLIICTVLSALLTIGPWMGFWQPAANSSNGQNVLGVLLLALITWKIATGKRWAWWLNVVVYSAGFAAVLLSFTLAPEVTLRIWSALPGYMIASAIIQYALQGAALAFLLGADSRKWFRARRAYAKALV